MAKVVGTVRRVPGPLPAFAAAKNARLVTLDVTDPASVARGVAEAGGWLSGIDVVVNKCRDWHVRRGRGLIDR